VPRRRNSDSGQYEEVYSTEEIVGLLQDTRLGTSEVADRLGCHRTTAHDRLNELERQGIITHDRVGNTHLWSLANDE